MTTLPELVNQYPFLLFVLFLGLPALFAMLFDPRDRRGRG